MSSRRCRVDGVAEEIRVGGVEALLIQKARVAEEPHVDLALVARVELESEIGDVLGALFRRGLRRGLRRWRLADDEHPRATIRDPDPRIVVAPRLAQQTFNRAQRSLEHDPCGRIGRAVLPVTTFLRRARYSLGLREQRLRTR